jgi:hypothetical protein
MKSSLEKERYISDHSNLSFRSYFFLCLTLVNETIFVIHNLKHIFTTFNLLIMYALYVTLQLAHSIQQQICLRLMNAIRANRRKIQYSL